MSIYDRYTPVRAETRFLVTPCCHAACVSSSAQACDTPEAVALRLWGCDVRHWVIYDGEVPYRFLTGDVGVITMVLRHQPSGSLWRQTLPVTILAGMLHCLGVGRLLHPDQTVCVIGDGPRVELPLQRKVPICP